MFIFQGVPSMTSPLKMDPIGFRPFFRGEKPLVSGRVPTQVSGSDFVDLSSPWPYHLQSAAIAPEKFFYFTRF